MARLDGTPGQDRIEGGRHRDVIRGFAGDDVLFGQSGDDHLIGGSGNDRLYGGLGSDVMAGGGGADRFIYTMADESGDLRGDVIVDFHQGEDKLVFRGDLQSAGLHFIETDAFSGTPGEVRYGSGGGTSSIVIDLDGDRSSDLTIVFTDEIHFQASDFSF